MDLSIKPLSEARLNYSASTFPELEFITKMALDIDTCLSQIPPLPASAVWQESTRTALRQRRGFVGRAAAAHVGDLVAGCAHSMSPWEGPELCLENSHENIWMFFHTPKHDHLDCESAVVSSCAAKPYWKGLSGKDFLSISFPQWLRSV